jgi:hypothetical protein
MTRIAALLLTSLLLAPAACSSRAANLPYDPGTTTVITPDGEVDVQVTPTGTDCITLADGPRAPCVSPQEQCPGGIADVVVNADGEVVSVTCLPPEVDYVSPVIDGQIPQNANNAVLTFDDAGNDPAYQDDLNVDGNNVVLYGDDPATSTLDGSLTVDGNNTVVRGITITGDVSIIKNDATFVYCVIRGSLTITANNAIIAGCEIWGDVTVEGNNASLKGNRIAGQVKGSGNLDCQDNVSFSDENEDGVITASELGDPLDC